MNITNLKVGDTITHQRDDKLPFILKRKVKTNDGYKFVAIQVGETITLKDHVLKVLEIEPTKVKLQCISILTK